MIKRLRNAHVFTPLHVLGFFSVLWTFNDVHVRSYDDRYNYAYYI